MLTVHNGTRDIFALAFINAHLSGKNQYESTSIATNFILSAMKNTMNDPSHWYGVKFEPVLKELVNSL